MRERLRRVREISNSQLNQVQPRINARDRRDARGTWSTWQVFFWPILKAALKVAHSPRRPGPVTLYRKCKTHQSTDRIPLNASSSSLRQWLRWGTATDSIAAARVTPIIPHCLQICEWLLHMHFLYASIQSGGLQSTGLIRTTAGTTQAAPDTIILRKRITMTGNHVWASNTAYTFAARSAIGQCDRFGA